MSKVSKTCGLMLNVLKRILGKIDPYNEMFEESKFFHSSN